MALEEIWREKSFNGLDPDILKFTRLERPKTNPPKGKSHLGQSTLGINRKRAAIHDLDGEPKRCYLIENKALNASEELSLEDIYLGEGNNEEQEPETVTGSQMSNTQQESTNSTESSMPIREVNRSLRGTWS